VGGSAFDDRHQVGGAVVCGGKSINIRKHAYEQTSIRAYDDTMIR
jgi:hypothetical protein